VQNGVAGNPGQRKFAESLVSDYNPKKKKPLVVQELKASIFEN
jgi:hypothetical protein